jgi:predicted amidohydrolase
MQSLDPIVDATVHAAANADLVVLPEGTLPAYVLGAARVDRLQIDEALDRFARIARDAGAVVVIGAAVPTESGTRNGAVVIDSDGTLAGRADKLFLWHFDRRWYTPGDRLAPIATSLGTLGVLVCADGRLPTIAAALVARGAQMLVMPTAWVTSGRDATQLENVQADLLARVRAYENRVPFVAANKCGVELQMVAYCGKSQIIDARGEIVAIASQHDRATLYATVELEEPRVSLAGRIPLSPVPPYDRCARIAISFDPLTRHIAERLELLDDGFVLAPQHSAAAGPERALPAAWVGDDVVLDPNGLVEYRRAGYVLIAWESGLETPWTERVARARALELRIYVAVFDRSARRAFAVDPDGTILAGTFGEYRLATFTFDPRKTTETLVAPGSDVREGLERVAGILKNAAD